MVWGLNPLSSMHFPCLICKIIALNTTQQLFLRISYDRITILCQRNLNPQVSLAGSKPRPCVSKHIYLLTLDISRKVVWEVWWVTAPK